VNTYVSIEERTERAATLDESAAILEELLGGGYSIWDDGSLYFIKQLIAKVRNLRIEVYPDEHPPPHFHVVYPGVNASFALSDGSLIKGQIGNRERALVKWWYDRSRKFVIQAWNDSRPNDCQVGPFVE
jgi:hypothetical protein